MISNLDKKKFNKVWQRILSSDRILLVSHINPDVDAISSLGVLIEVLKTYNKKYIAFAEKKGDDYHYLPNFEDVISDKDELLGRVGDEFNGGIKAKEDFLKYFDLVIIVDCGSIERTFISENIHIAANLMLETFIVEIDHHLPVKTYANIEIKTQLSSATELLYYFLKENKLEINRNMANCILAGILTDTGNFLYSSVNEKTLEISSEMMSLGAQFPKLLNSTWRNKNFLEMKIWGTALNNLKINKKYNIAFSVLSYEDLNLFRNISQDLSSDIFGDIVAFMSSLSEANVVLLLREEEPGKIKGSLRVGSSDKDIDVACLASYFGGGGHKKAAGFMVEGKIVKENNRFKIQ
ncbi:hypothetical protein CVU82_03355 [Candidatus Falkowbacteria bacterium HGW-Falkowbacteria-1]|uniref:Uncharacterized protein n=1 Tax=Candidatus Falkowbacteria bacterium HGW-Falkowbacteria-1 TaxID=2013768 RepID=A0A2N2E8L9_9BACT|nr:MAG: hypothetical protein CVU82_03355 [Candidatus Falkowbacteria bacterium HGW-Falkowbacteria-1]